MKTFGNIACIGLAVIGVLVSCAFGYYKMFNTSFTMGTNNIGNQSPLDIVDIKHSEDLTTEQINELETRVFMNANYFSNEKNNGIELQELRFDYFTSYNLNYIDMRSSGMQHVGNYVHQLQEPVTYSEKEKKNYNKDSLPIGDYGSNSFYYYDTTNFVSWNGQKGKGLGEKDGGIGTKLDRGEYLTIKIEDKPFAVKLNGAYTEEFEYYEELSTAENVGNVVLGGLPVLVGGLFGKDWRPFKPDVKVGLKAYKRTYSELFEYVMHAVKSQNKGVGEYYLSVDLSDYFTVYEYDSNGQIDHDKESDIIKNYVLLKFNYNDNGAVASSQSMFGTMENNSKYDRVFDGYDTNYWQERIIYNLTEKDLSLRNSDVLGGNLASLSLASKQLFQSMPRVKVNIVLDLNKTKIVGFDYNAFENFEIDTITLTSKNDVKFMLLDKCLIGTKLQKFQHSDLITLDVSNSACDFEIKAVVI